MGSCGSSLFSRKRRGDEPNLAHPRFSVTPEDNSVTTTNDAELELDAILYKNAGHEAEKHFVLQPGGTDLIVHSVMTCFDRNSNLYWKIILVLPDSEMIKIKQEREKPRPGRQRYPRGRRVSSAKFPTEFHGYKIFYLTFSDFLKLHGLN